MSRGDLLVVLTPAAGGEGLALPAPSDLRWTTALPGGYGPMSCTLTLPSGTATPDALVTYAHARVVDRATGLTHWYGVLADPGLTIGPDGQQYSLTGEGAQIVTDSWREVYGLVDRDQGSWQAVGDYSPAQSSILGDLYPGGTDLTWDPANLDLDFPGLTDFPGIDYPPGADYPGYTGYIGDPFVGPGGSMPIPGTDGDIRLGADTGVLAGWIPGITGSVPGADTGNGATVTVTSGWSRFTSGSTPNGQTARRNFGNSLMEVIGPRMYDGSGFYLGNTYGIATVIARFKLVDSQAAARVWLYGDDTLSDSGLVLEVTTTTITWYQVAAGVPTSVNSVSKTTTVGTDYELRASPFGPAAVIPAGTITPGSADDSDWTVPYHDVSWAAGTPDYDLFGAWSDQAGIRWAGIGVLGDGSGTSRAVDFKGWVVRRYNPFVPE